MSNIELLSKLPIKKINIKGWYILQNLFNCDVLTGDIYQFKQFKIIKYEPLTNKLWLALYEIAAEYNYEGIKEEELKYRLSTEQQYGVVLDWKHIDKWFIINNKVDAFKSFLMNYA